MQIAYICWIGSTAVTFWNDSQKSFYALKKKFNDFQVILSTYILTCFFLLTKRVFTGNRVLVLSGKSRVKSICCTYWFFSILFVISYYTQINHSWSIKCKLKSDSNNRETFECIVLKILRRRTISNYVLKIQ